MKKTIIIVIALMYSALSFAQNNSTEVSSPEFGTPEVIETFVAKEHDAEWYGAQAQAWQKKVDENLKDQWAWRNLFRSTNYYDMFGHHFGEDQDKSKTADVIRKMEAALPDSYVLNLCKGRFCLSTDSAALRGDNIYRAIELMPEDANAEDVDYLACQLWRFDQENSKLTELNKKTYEQGYYPERILRYNWNMLRSMQPNALYFGNGDAILKPMKMLQDALNERTDVTVIPISCLFDEGFRNTLCKRLGIQPMTISFEEYRQSGDNWSMDCLNDMIMYLIRESKRPAYFFSDVLVHVNINKECLYNEGLLLKYSEKPYDNFGVAMHNVKEVYHLEYLAEPDLVPDRWVTSLMLDMNHVTLLANLISKLSLKGDVAESKRLYRILQKCVERSTCHEPKLKSYLEDMLKAEIHKAEK